MIPIHSPSPVELDRRRLDKGDAPEGYVAVLKFDNPSGVNICSLCDYRPECIKNQRSGKILNAPVTFTLASGESIC